MTLQDACDILGISLNASHTVKVAAFQARLGETSDREEKRQIKQAYLVVTGTQEPAPSRSESTGQQLVSRPPTEVDLYYPKQEKPRYIEIGFPTFIYNGAPIGISINQMLHKDVHYKKDVRFASMIMDASQSQYIKFDLYAPRAFCLAHTNRDLPVSIQIDHERADEWAIEMSDVIQKIRSDMEELSAIYTQYNDVIREKYGHRFENVAIDSTIGSIIRLISRTRTGSPESGDDGFIAKISDLKEKSLHRITNLYSGSHYDYTPEKFHTFGYTTETLEEWNREYMSAKNGRF